MFVIFSREIRALLKNIKLVSVAAFFIMATAFFFINNSMAVGYSAIQPLFAHLPLVVSIVIPPVVVFSFHRERRDAGANLILAMPVTRFKALLGKLLAVFCFFMIPVAVMAIYPIILAFVGASNIWQGYVTYFLFILCVAFFVAMSAMFASLFKKTWLALTVNYATVVVLYVLGLISVLFGNTVESIFNWFSPYRRFDPILFDIFDLSSILYFLSFTALFVFVCAMMLRNGGVSKKAAASRKISPIVAAIVIASTLALNVGASVLPKSSVQLDASPNGTYGMSDASYNFLENLSEDITIYVVDPIGDTKLDIFMEHYAEQSDRITLVEVSAEDSAAFWKEYGVDASSVAQNSMIVKSSKRWKLVDPSECYSYYYAGSSQYVQKGFMSMIEYFECRSYYTQMFQQYQEAGASEDVLSSIYETIESLAKDSFWCFNPEHALTPAIEYVTRRYIPKIYLTSNHGEKNATDNPIDLSKLTKVPEDAGLIIINDPESDFSAKEVEMLSKYLKGSGRIFLLTDKESSRFENLSALTAEIGLTVEDGVAEVDGNTTVTAVSNANAEFLSSIGIGTLTLTDANVIKTSENSKYTTLPILALQTSTSSEGDSEDEAEDDSAEGEDEQSEFKYLAVAAVQKTANGYLPKLTWFTASDTFNQSTEGKTDEEKLEYIKLVYARAAAAEWMRVEFSSNLSENFKTPEAYSAAIIEISTGACVFVGFVFIGILPLGYIGITFLRKHIRKRRSETAINESR